MQNLDIDKLAFINLAHCFWQFYILSKPGDDLYFGNILLKLRSHDWGLDDLYLTNVEQFAGEVVSLELHFERQGALSAEIKCMSLVDVFGAIMK